MTRVKLPPGIGSGPPLPMFWLSSLPDSVRKPIAKRFAEYPTDPMLRRQVVAFIDAARAGTMFSLDGWTDGTGKPVPAPPIPIPDVSFALRLGKVAVLNALSPDFRGASEPCLHRLIVATKAVRDAFLSVPANKVWCRKRKCGSPHLLPGPWMEALRQHGDAVSDVLALFHFTEETANRETGTPQSTVVLTGDHEAILATMGTRPRHCWMVHEVASAGTIRNRETVGGLMADLEENELIHKPFPKRRGRALTDAGRKVLADKTPAQMPS